MWSRQTVKDFMKWPNAGLSVHLIFRLMLALQCAAVFLLTGIRGGTLHQDTSIFDKSCSVPRVAIFIQSLNSS